MQGQPLLDLNHVLIERQVLGNQTELRAREYDRVEDRPILLVERTVHEDGVLVPRLLHRLSGDSDGFAAGPLRRCSGGFFGLPLSYLQHRRPHLLPGHGSVARELSNFPPFRHTRSVYLG